MSISQLQTPSIPRPTAPAPAAKPAQVQRSAQSSAVHKFAEMAACCFFGAQLSRSQRQLEPSCRRIKLCKLLAEVVSSRCVSFLHRGPPTRKLSGFMLNDHQAKWALHLLELGAHQQSAHVTASIIWFIVWAEEEVRNVPTNLA